MLNDEALKQAVDRETVERFLVGAEVNEAKIRLYLQHAERDEVRRHLQLMLKGNARARQELERLLPQLS